MSSTTLGFPSPCARACTRYRTLLDCPDRWDSGAASQILGESGVSPFPRCFYEEVIDRDQSYDWSDVFFLTQGKFELGPHAVRNRRQHGPHHTMIHQVLNAKAINAGEPDLATELLSMRIKDLLKRANEDEVRLSMAKENRTWAQNYANVWYNVYRAESDTPTKRDRPFAGTS